MPYLTPDTAPPDTVCRTLVIPNDKFWLSIVNGALSDLGYSYRYEKFGTATPEETAAVFQAMFEDYLVSACMNGQLLVSPQDTTPGYLQDKLAEGRHITLTKNNAGANESLTIATDTAIRRAWINFTYLNAAPVLITTLPAGAWLSEVQVYIDAPFDNAFVASVGVPSVNDFFMAGNENDTSAEGAYTKLVNYPALGSTEIYLYTPNPGATQGAGRVVLIFED